MNQSPFELFKTAAFKVRRRSDGAEFDAVQVIYKYKGPLPDRPHFEDVEQTLEETETSFDPHTGKKIVKVLNVKKVKNKAKCFTFTGEASSDCHGGVVCVYPGDILIKDGDTYFGVPEFDRRTRKPIFSEKYVKI